MKAATKPDADALTVTLHKRLASELEWLRATCPPTSNHEGITWGVPPELRLPRWFASMPTSAELLALVERDSARIVQHMAQQIVADATRMVAPAMLQAVLARTGMVADRWLWPDTAASGVESFHALETLQLAAMTSDSQHNRRGQGREDPSNRLWVRWPGEAAPLEVMTWARAKMNALCKGCGDDLVQQAESGKIPQVKAEHDDKDAIPSTFHLALLFTAERDVKDGQKRRSIAIDASKAHHGLLTGMRDVTKRGPHGFDCNKDRVELLAPGRSVQLMLALPGESPSEALVHVLRDWRSWFGLRNWAAMQRLFSVEGKREGWVRWNLDAHMAALGYDASDQRDPKKRERVAKEVELLTEMELAVYDADGKERERAPLVHVGRKFDRLHGSEWRLEGMELCINPAVYRGVRDDNGKLGRLHHPAPVELAQVDDVHHPYTLALGLVLPIRWRWAKGDGRKEVTLTGAKVLELAGIPFKSTRAAKAWNALERDLAELQRIGGLGEWKWTRGERTLAGVMELHPAAWALDRTMREVRPLELAPAPAILTGAELTTWRKGKGWTQLQAAKELGVGVRTVKRAEAEPATALGPALSKALAPKV